MPNTPERPRRVRVDPDGPLLVEGPVEVVADDGSITVSRRFTVALCTCRRSRSYPWCDTSHRRREKAGGQKPGGEKPGASPPGDETPTAGDTPGDEKPAGGTPRDETPAGRKPGDETPAGRKPGRGEGPSPRSAEDAAPAPAPAPKGTE